MYQKIDTQKLHPFVVINYTTGEQATTLTDPICKYRINGGTKTSYSFSISAYDSEMKTFLITVPSSLATTAYDSIEISVVSDEGEAHLMIDVVPDQDTLPTASDVVTAVLAAEIRTGRTVSQVLKLLEFVPAATVSGLTSGAGSPVTFTLAGSTITYTVDANKNRTGASINLV